MSEFIQVSCVVAGSLTGQYNEHTSQQLTTTWLQPSCPQQGTVLMDATEYTHRHQQGLIRSTVTTEECANEPHLRPVDNTHNYVSNSKSQACISIWSKNTAMKLGFQPWPHSDWLTPKINSNLCFHVKYQLVRCDLWFIQAKSYGLETRLKRHLQSTN